MKGCTISTRPLAPFHGSRGFPNVVSTGVGLAPALLGRSEKFATLLVLASWIGAEGCPATGFRADGGVRLSLAKDNGLTWPALPALLAVGSPEYSSHRTLPLGATLPPQNFCVVGGVLSRTPGGALFNTGMLLRLARWARLSSTGDTSRMERNRRGSVGSWCPSSGSGVLGGEISAAMVWLST